MGDGMGTVSSLRKLSSGGYRALPQPPPFRDRVGYQLPALRPTGEVAQARCEPRDMRPPAGWLQNGGYEWGGGRLSARLGRLVTIPGAETPTVGTHPQAVLPNGALSGIRRDNCEVRSHVAIHADSTSNTDLTRRPPPFKNKSC